VAAARPSAHIARVPPPTTLSPSPAITAEPNVGLIGPITRPRLRTQAPDRSRTHPARPQPNRPLSQPTHHRPLTPANSLPSPSCFPIILVDFFCLPYGWAARPTRRLVDANPLLGIELPPSDEKPRERVADAEEAAALLAALAPEDAVPYALAFYAGLRRAEIRRLEWPDVQLDGYRLIVRKSKSEAGTGRRPPIAEPLRPILLAAFMQQGRRDGGPVSAVSVMSGKLAGRARDRWEAVGLEPITLHECRHTYASFLMAAGYTLRELMEYMGHSSLQATERYVKLLPPLDETDPAERLNAFLRRRAAG
jgi:integrase